MKKAVFIVIFSYFGWLRPFNNLTLEANVKYGSWWWSKRTMGGNQSARHGNKDNNIGRGGTPWLWRIMLTSAGLAPMWQL